MAKAPHYLCIEIHSTLTKVEVVILESLEHDSKVFLVFFDRTQENEDIIHIYVYMWMNLLM